MIEVLASMEKRALRHFQRQRLRDDREPRFFTYSVEAGAQEDEGSGKLSHTEKIVFHKRFTICQFVTTRW